MDGRDENQRPAPWVRLAFSFAIWTLLGLAEASHSYFRYRSSGDPVPAWQILALGLSLWYAWALLWLLVVPFCRWFPIEQRHWKSRVALHCCAAPAFAGVKMLMDYPIIEAFYCPDCGLMPLTTFLKMAFNSQFHTYVLIYGAMVGVAHALSYYRRYRERELKTAQLEAKLAQGQLQLLRAQLHPHFLFNTLNAISALIHKDTEVADRMIARLGDLLRLTLDNVGNHDVSLQQELEFVQAYLEIEQVRFGERLSVTYRVEPEAREVQVPYLILQPLVENSVRHGIAHRPAGGRLEVRACRIAGRLRLEVWDDGPGPGPAGRARNGRKSSGIGLSNTQARLQQMYGDDHRFEFGSGPAGGTLVTIEIPAEANTHSPDGTRVATGAP